MRLSIGIAKSCCYVAYDGLTNESYEFYDGSVWTIQEAWAWHMSGFKAILLRQAGAGAMPVLAFAGTDSVRDVIADAAQVIGILPIQYGQALKLSRAHKGDGSLHLTGHSLGGGLAAYSALHTGLFATTVNPAPLVAASNLSAWFMPNRHITNYIAGGREFVSSSIGTNPGQSIAVEASGNFFTRHSLNNVEPRIVMPRKVPR